MRRLRLEPLESRELLSAVSFFWTVPEVEVAFPASAAVGEEAVAAPAATAG